MMHGTLAHTSSRTLSHLVLLATLSAAAPVAAQSAGRVGTIIIAHGADSVWNSHVIDVAKAVRTGGPVEVSFLMGPAARTTKFQDAVARLEAQRVAGIVVVPMLVSSHSGHYEQIRYLTGENVSLDETMLHHLHMSGIERAATRVPIRLMRALDDAPQVARVLADRALAVASASGAQPRERALLIVGHGPNSAEDYAAWMKHLRPIADSVKALTGFRDVRVDLVRDDAPAEVRAEAVRRVRELIELQFLVTGRQVMVVPVLVSKGAVSRDKIPSDLTGLPIEYAGEPLLPHPAIVRWVEERVRAGTNPPGAAGRPR